MRTIKLSEWCEKTGVKYLTAWRWFKGDKMPVHAYQTDSGTILVEDDLSDENVDNSANKSNDAMSLFLKKTVEFSKSNSTVEDFAAYVISNFQLKINGSSDAPKYSKNKPQAETIQNHFKQFLPDREKEEHLKAVKTLLKEGKSAGDVVPASDAPIPGGSTLEEEKVLLAGLIREPYDTEDFTDRLVKRSVDCNTTPQQINYTGSNYQPISEELIPVFNTLRIPFNSQQVPFQPTTKETKTASKVIETLELSKINESLPKRRGRKSKANQ